MATDFGVSVTLINQTVTSYLIVAGVAPEFMGDLADQGGRRPAYILMFILVVGSNIGLALTRSFAGLFVLRMVQSAGASGDIYHLDYLQAGLIYLSSGIGGGIATYSTGKSSLSPFTLTAISVLHVSCADYILTKDGS